MAASRYDRFAERVRGIGGFFFRARDPDALNRWYADHLGVVPPTGNYDDPGWFPDRGETVFTAFSPDSDAFGGPEKTWKINFRVNDLPRMVAQLQAAGIEVQGHDREYPNGRFAELADPEGNRIQLWEPNAASRARDPGPA
jgi:glyoxylase I family protein